MPWMKTEVSRTSLKPLSHVLFLSLMRQRKHAALLEALSVVMVPIGLTLPTVS